jgi:hypothetical protein
VSAVCWKCIEDEFLKKIVKKRGTRAKCDLCDKVMKSFTPEDLAEVLDPIMREHFKPGEDVKRFGEDDNDWWEQEGDPLSHHVEEVIGQYLGFEDEIVAALERNDPARPQDGEFPFFDGTQDYVSTPTRPYAYYAEWEYVSENLKHRRRFFSSAASDFFSRVFGDVETRTSRNDETREIENVVWAMPEGSELFRARICHTEALIKDAYTDPLKHIGPPPPEHARAGRMNVEGVVAFYGALDAETCLAETRPAIGNDISVIKLRTTKALRILDFRRLEQSYKELSYFQPDFTEQVERGAFLRRLQNLISQPVVPGREMDYLITQTMAEYLAHVYQPPFEGILFKSVQRSGGTNIVLFQNRDGNFPLSYVDESFDLYSTTSIEYRHQKGYVGKHEDGEIWVSHDHESWDDED